MLPTTPGEYNTYLKERLNWLEGLTARASSLDERIDVTNHLLMELLKVSSLPGGDPTSPFPPALSAAIIEHLTKDKPEFYKFIDIDLSEARTNIVYLESGTFMWIDNQFARGNITLRLNEESFDAFDLRRQRFIEGPFYRFIIDNVAGQGTIRLFISKGYHAGSEPVEAITRAELAARLGSIVTFDRRGDVVWFDDFLSGVKKWTFASGGTGSAFEWSAAAAKFGGYSGKLITGDTVGDTGSIRKVVIPQPLSRMGLEYCFTTEEGLSEMLFYPYIDDGTTWIWPFIKYLPGYDTLQYFGSDFAYHDLDTDLTLYEDITNFHTIKVVADINKREYVRCLVDNISFDMTGIPVYAADSLIQAAMIDINIKTTTRLPSNQSIYIDHVIVTQNEP